MNHAPYALVNDELSVLSELVDVSDQKIIELGCGAARLARVLRPGGHFYVSEPVYSGPLNEIVRLFNDEGEVRLAAQAAVDEAMRSREWIQVAERRFDMPVRFRDFEDFEQRMMRSTFADHRTDEDMLSAVRARFAPHCSAEGAYFTRPMHVRLLRRQAYST